MTRLDPWLADPTPCHMCGHPIGTHRHQGTTTAQHMTTRHRAPTRTGYWTYHYRTAALIAAALALQAIRRQMNPKPPHPRTGDTP